MNLSFLSQRTRAKINDVMLFWFTTIWVAGVSYVACTLNHDALIADMDVWNVIGFWVLVIITYLIAVPFLHFSLFFISDLFD